MILRILAFSTIFLFCTGSLLAQEIHFFDVKGNRITREKFEKLHDNRVNLGLSFQKGKITETRLVSRIETGVIPQDLRNQILSNIEVASGKEINRLEMIIIYYYQGKDKCNSSGNKTATLEERKAYMAEYEKQIAKLGQTSGYSLHSIDDRDKDTYGLKKSYPDVDLLVEKTFFKYKYPCGSFVIIRPDGEYSAYFGEYSADQVVKLGKKLLE